MVNKIESERHRNMEQTDESLRGGRKRLTKGLTYGYRLKGAGRAGRGGNWAEEGKGRNL